MNFYVTPCVGVWIEIEPCETEGSKQPEVTPCVGVWIEITQGLLFLPLPPVTPCVGVWIEIAHHNHI